MFIYRRKLHNYTKKMYYPKTAGYGRSESLYTNKDISPVEMVGGISYSKNQDIYRKNIINPMEKLPHNYFADLGKGHYLHMGKDGRLYMGMYDNSYLKQNGINQILDKPAKNPDLSPDDPIKILKKALSH